MKNIMIVAGEASGDMHGAKLVEAMKTADPDLNFLGVGSHALRAQGVEIMYESEKIAVVGIFEVLFHLTEIRATMNGLTSRMQSTRPSLLILIDFPDFNLILAKRAKKLGIPVFYFISPQVWAWRSGRIKTIAERVNKLAVILPFEKDFYKQRGMKHVEFVGHPLLDTVRTSQTKEYIRNKHKIPQDSIAIGLLPGSRKKEISSILPNFLKAAKLLAQEKNNLFFILPLAPTIQQSELNLTEEEMMTLNLRVISDENRYNTMSCCDLVMAASGTVTLELAILNIPMVVAYRISPITYFLGRRLIKVQYASLVNLVAGKEVVKELIQDDFTPENIKESICDIWPDSEKHKTLRHQLTDVTASLGTPGASKNAAALALEVIQDHL